MIGALEIIIIIAYILYFSSCSCSLLLLFIIYVSKNNTYVSLVNNILVNKKYFANFKPLTQYSLILLVTVVKEIC